MIVESGGHQPWKKASIGVIHQQFQAILPQTEGGGWDGKLKRCNPEPAVYMRNGGHGSGRHLKNGFCG
jgi:hypothetical protein